MKNVEKMILNKFKFIILSISLLFFIFLGCKKTDLKYTFTGQIKGIDGNGLANIAVIVQEGNIGVSQAFKQIGNTTSDANGNYSVTVPRNQVSTIRIAPNHDAYYASSKDINIESLSVKDDNVENFTIYGKSWVRFHISNPSGDNDALNFRKITGEENCEDCCANGETYYSGLTNTHVTCGGYAGTYLRFGMHQPELAIYEEDSVLLVQGDTIQYQVSF